MLLHTYKVEFYSRATETLYSKTVLAADSGDVIPQLEAILGHDFALFFVLVGITEIDK